MAETNAANTNAERLAELAALVDAVKQRVRNQYPLSTTGTTGEGAEGTIRVELPDLSPLARARDAAAGKMAAIGTVNPRAGGPVNSVIQGVKRTISRALNWFVRDQVTFNRQTIACMETCIETLADVNRAIYALAGQTGNQIGKVRTEVLAVDAKILRSKTSEIDDLAAHWHRWREEWQLKLHKNEVEFLRAVADLNLAFSQRATRSEAASEQRARDLYQNFQHELQKTAAEFDSSYRQTAKELEAACQQTALRIEAAFAGAIVPLENRFQQKIAQLETAYFDQAAQFGRRAEQIEHDTAVALKTHHDAFEQLANSNAESIQQSTASQIGALAREISKQGGEFERSLATSIGDLQKKFYRDLEQIRMEYERVIHAELRVVRQRLAAGAASPAAAPASTPAVAAPVALPFDYARFADRFRGSEEYVSESQRIYVPYFSGRRHVLDLGCGRGEFLKLMRDAGVPARGIEASEESVAQCRSLSLDAEKADLFAYLATQPEASLDGIFCAQVVEHLAADRLPEMVRLCASRLATGGILAIETPNPECLAIFGTHFYLDPTHTRPVPAQLLAFYMEEFGMGRIEVRRKAPAIESMPEVGELPAAFREKFFDGLDYAIIAFRL